MKRPADDVIVVFTDASYNMSWRCGVDCTEGWRNLKRSLSLDELRIAYLTQTHSPVIREVKRHGYQGPGDGLFTSRRGIGLVIFTADCAPVIFYDTLKGFIFALHCGWRPLSSGIMNNVREILENLSINPERTMAFIGPCIGPCCYEVGEEFRRFFPPQFFTRKNKLFFDMRGFIKHTLASMGIKKVENESLCTCCSDSFFSYRCRGDTMRQIGMVIKLG